MPFKKGETGNRNGRPKLGTDLRYKINAYFNEKEVAEVMALLKERLKDPKNTSLLQFTVEQLFGKAAQRIEVAGQNGQPIVVVCDPAALSRYKQNADVPTPKPKTS